MNIETNKKDRLLDFKLDLVTRRECHAPLTVRFIARGEVVTVTGLVQPDSVTETRRLATTDEMRLREELNIVFQRALGRREREERLAREAIPPMPGSSGPRTCTKCDGGGEVHWNPSPINDPQLEQSATCPRCDGKGTEPEEDHDGR
jgi:hypothetical protein